VTEHDWVMNTTFSAPCMHSCFYDDEELNSTVLRRAKSDVEEVMSSVILPPSITDPILKEPKKKKAFALALHLKRQREREKQKHVGDRMVTEMIEEMLAKYILAIFELGEGRAVSCLLAISEKIHHQYF